MHELGNHFQVDLESGPSVQFRLTDPGASVTVHDESGAVECLG